MSRPAAPTPPSAKPIPSSSIPTSTACSPTAAAACSSAIPPWAASTSMTRPIPTSPRSKLHLGEISLECSRAGAAAVALWATHQLLPLTPGGEFAHGLARGRAAALDLDRRLRADARFQPSRRWLARNSTSWCGSSALPMPPAPPNWRKAVFAACAARDLHLALVQLPHSWFGTAPVAENSNPQRVCYLSAFRADEARARRLARQDMGKIYGCLRGCHGRMKRCLEGGWNLAAEENVVNHAGYPSCLDSSRQLLSPTRNLHIRIHFSED